MATLERWAKALPFNPVSPTQLKSYCGLKGYEIPKHRKTKKPTLDEEAIEKILRKHGPDKVLEMSLEARHLSKAIGYLKGNYIGRDGKFHPIYTFRPETGRLSAIRPNIQNQPNGGVDAELARAIRKCVVPSAPGRVLLECDWKAMEAVLTGYFANDPDYIAISKKDSHSYFAAFILTDRGVIHEPIPKPAADGIDEFLAWIKHDFKPVRAEAKAVNLATGYGMQWFHLSEQLRCSAAQAKRYLALKAEMAPKIEAWKNNTWLEAHRKGYLETPFGYCVTPDTKVLTAELRWVTADTLKVGDELITLDEFLKEGNRARHYNFGKVEAVTTAIREVAAVLLSDGSRVVTTLDHPWLTMPKGTGANRWVSTESLEPGDPVVKAMDVWNEDTSYEAGWLAGFFDGEGSWTRSQKKHTLLSASQLPGIVLEQAKSFLNRLGFTVKVYDYAQKVASLHIQGGFAEALRFIGSVRPARLLQKIRSVVPSEVYRKEPVHVVSIVYLGKQQIVQMQTDTHTFFAEGFAMHNCNYYWNVLEPIKGKPGKFRPGREANEALAFRPQSSGAAMLREMMLDIIAFDGIDEGGMFDLLAPIHDAVLVECEERRMEETKETITKRMERPWEELGGLSIGADAKWSKTSWADMEEVD